MDNSEFLFNAARAKAVNKLYLKEKIEIGHILLLTEIIVREINNDFPPNVKWIQTELQISFTKVKSIIEDLEERGFIYKKVNIEDNRVRDLFITKAGSDYIYKLTSGLGEVVKNIY